MRLTKVVILLAAAGSAQAAITSLTCASTGAPALIRQEGITERLGDLLLTCTGDPGGQVGASISVFLSAPVTNRVNGDGQTDAILTIDVGPSATPVSATARLVGSNALVFDQLNFNLTGLGIANMRITNVRINAAGGERSITGLISTNGLSRIAVNPNPVTIGVVRPGLLANNSVANILCNGSPAPESLTWNALIEAGTQHATMRVTEGHTEAFQKRLPNSDSGTRIMVRYEGFPAAAKIYVPDVIAGSSATQQTSAGELGVPQAAGRYTPGGFGALLLVRVRAHDNNGAGGSPFYTPGPPGSGTVQLENVSEVNLAFGAGLVVYEVVDSYATVLESAHIPTFLSLPRTSGGAGTIATAKVSFAPASTATAASESAPVPRFHANATPGIDCSILQDCSADYFPKLFVDAPNLTFEGQAGVPGYLGKFIRILNDNGGLMVWRTSITYKSGSNWLRVSQETGVNNASIILDAYPDRVQPGIYEATLTIDAGPVAGVRSLPVVMLATTAPPPSQNPQQPLITRVANSADINIQSLTPGSAAALYGQRLAGNDPRVTLDGIEARILSRATDRIDFVVPAALGLKPTAQLTVAIEGISSAAFPVTLAVAAPAIFPGGVLNQDGFPNNAGNPEIVGNVMQVYAAGLPAPALGTITARIHDRDITAPFYAGPSPGVPGVQQVNFPIPDDLPEMVTEVIVCGFPVNAPGQRACSRPVLVWIRR